MTARVEKIKTYFNDQAPFYPKYRKRFSYYWSDAIHYFNYFLTENDSVLQIGCGSGDTLDQLTGSHKVGIDISEGMVNVAKDRYPDLEFHVMSAENFSLNQKFDVIVISNTIGYFNNVSDAFNRLHRVSHEHTKIYIQYYSSLWKPILNFFEFLGLKKKGPELNWLAPSDIKNLLYLSGFESFRSARRMLLPINIPIISWLVNKYIARLPFFNLLCLSQYVFARKAPTSNDISKRYSISVIIPTRNESGNIENALKRIPNMGKWTELIFIEGNSTDDTWDKINEMAAKYGDKLQIRMAKQDGKGKYDAVKKGFDLAKGDILIIEDADLAVLPEDLPKFYDALASGKGDFINGSRLIYPMDGKAMRFFNMVGNKFFSYAFSWLLGQPIKDTLCGTKAMFKKDYIKLKKNRKFFGDFDPFGDFDQLFGAYKLNLKIIDLPIRYQERTYGETNISRWKHGLVLLRMVFFALGKIKFY